jgi:hypothetical protein
VSEKVAPRPEKETMYPRSRGNRTKALGLPAGGTGTMQSKRGRGATVVVVSSARR